MACFNFETTDDAPITVLSVLDELSLQRSNQLGGGAAVSPVERVVGSFIGFRALIISSACEMSLLHLVLMCGSHSLLLFGAHETLAATNR